MNKEVDGYLQNEKRWKDEFVKLREIALSCNLKEEFKWMKPCYSLNGKNVVLIHGFKEYCAYLFFKGALMKDPENLLVQQTVNVQSPRQIRFTNVKEVDELAPKLKEYILEAMEVELSGKKVKLKKTNEYEVPVEFQRRLDENPELKESFESLTPGRRRAYLFYFASAKQTKTREDRIDKFVSKILGGKGMDD